MRFSLKFLLLLISFWLGVQGLANAQVDSVVEKRPEPVVDSSARQDTTAPKQVIKRVVKPPVVKDSVKMIESVAANVDSTPLPALPDSLFQKADTAASHSTYGSFTDSLLYGHPYFKYRDDPANLKTAPFTGKTKDELFYAICSVLLFIGLLRLGFPKYFSDLFNVFWRSPVRQNQLRDQLQQAGLTNLLFNIFFLLTVSLFVFLGIVYNKGMVLQPWLLFSLCVFAIMVLYVGKFAILKISGWMFGKTDAADTYIFIVFLVNKVLAILLLPLIVLLAFSSPQLQQIAFTIAISMIVLLFLYRFVLSFTGIRNELKISGLHLFLYVCGFEIMPVLVIYRVMLHLLERSS